ncbi:MAG: hypothetical protein SVR94_08740 [Pseudomonadota bacterium]|nr:hypothetical protein [Pseudomonadota bacterium]
MRSLALLLLLMNIGFLAWQSSGLSGLPWQPAQFATVAPPMDDTQSSLPQLVLLQERQQVTSPAQKPITAADKPGAETANISPKQVTKTTERTLNSREPQQETDKHLKSDEIPNDKAIKMSKLQQLEQLPTTTGEQNSKTSQLTPTPVPPPLNVAKKPPAVKPKQEILACFQIGPYTQLRLATQAVEWFKQQASTTQAKIIERETKILDSTWVYLPSFKTNYDARQEQKQLAQKGVTDHMIVTSGQFKNAISLGLYRNPNSVERRLRELQTKGYTQVKTEKRYQRDTRYWLNVKLFEKTPKALRKAFNNQFKEKTFQSVACE